MGNHTWSGLHRRVPPERTVSWPKGFWWGTGASSTQCEGAAPASDWWDWEQAGRAADLGRRQRLRHPLRRGLRPAGCTPGSPTTASRSIEGSHRARGGKRVTRPRCEHYRDVLSAARDAGLEPWVTCCTTSCCRGGWPIEVGSSMSRTAPRRWARHVDFMADTYGDLVFGWKPVNEVQHPALPAARLPAGLDPARALGQHASGASRRRRSTSPPQRPVPGCARPASPCAPSSTWPASSCSTTTPPARSRPTRMHRTGYGIGLDLLQGAGTRRPRPRADRAPGPGRLYRLLSGSPTTSRSRARRRAAADVPGRSSDLAPRVRHPRRGRRSGARRAAPPRPRAADRRRGVRHRHRRRRRAGRPTRRARHGPRPLTERGIDVRGLFHWTAVDNYEWLHGYDVQFGIIDRDRNVRPSADVLKDEATAS